MWVLNVRQGRRIRSHRKPPTKRNLKKSNTIIEAEMPTKSLHVRVNTEKIILRAMQIFVFMITNVFADAVIDLQEWISNFSGTLSKGMLFVLLMFALAKFLYQQVPNFLACMACPPYVNEENMGVLLIVLFDDHIGYRLTQTLATG